MTQDAITILQTMWNTAYSYLNGFYIPGTNGVTPLGLILGASCAVIAVKFIKGALNSGDR